MGNRDEKRELNIWLVVVILTTLCSSLKLVYHSDVLGGGQSLWPTIKSICRPEDPVVVGLGCCGRHSKARTANVRVDRMSSGWISEDASMLLVSVASWLDGQ